MAFQPNWNYGEQWPNGYNSPPAQGWVAAPSSQYQPGLVQNYPNPVVQTQRPPKNECALSKLKLSSVTNLLAGDVPECIPGAQIFNNGVPALQQQGAQYLCHGAALYDLISSKLDSVVTLIDGGGFSGEDAELAVFQPPQQTWQQQGTGYSAQEPSKGKLKECSNNPISSALTGTNHFSKVYLYANSRLPPDLPPMKLYPPTFPLLCLAAQYSERVYTKPAGKERETHVDSDWMTGTKAMVIKSVPMDDMNTIVFAIRGTQSFMDWAVNLRTSPASPKGFLDDPGNLCHAGFLAVARKMIKPVAARLRNLLQEDHVRSKYSLLITGHSAGGAVAALLYMHMLSTSHEAVSELNTLTSCLKRVHCITFGAPPISLLPLSKPSDPALRKSVFLSFVNEGDPVPRAEKAYVRSLLELYSTPAPGSSCLETATPHKLQPLIPGLGGRSSSFPIVNKSRPTPKKSQTVPIPGVVAPIWEVPEATLSIAGRVVLLRSAETGVSQQLNQRKKQIHEMMMDEGVVAQMATDELLRGVVWGDPVCHMMKLYARRIEVLATKAVMGREC